MPTLSGGMLGYLAPDRPWRWGLVVMLAQAVTLAVLASSVGHSLPVITSHGPSSPRQAPLDPRLHRPPHSDHV